MLRVLDGLRRGGLGVACCVGALGQWSTSAGWVCVANLCVHVLIVVIYFSLFLFRCSSFQLIFACREGQGLR